MIPPTRWIFAIGLVAATLLGQPVASQPTEVEVREAYQSKAATGKPKVPGGLWERWKVKEVRGWSLKYTRVANERSMAVITRKYLIVAKKNDACSEYLVTDVTPVTANPQIRPSLSVEATGLKVCR